MDFKELSSKIFLYKANCTVLPVIIICTHLYLFVDILFYISMLYKYVGLLWCR